MEQSIMDLKPRKIEKWHSQLPPDVHISTAGVTSSGSFSRAVRPILSSLRCWTMNLVIA